MVKDTKSKEDMTDDELLNLVNGAHEIFTRVQVVLRIPGGEETVKAVDTVINDYLNQHALEGLPIGKVDDKHIQALKDIVRECHALRNWRCRREVEKRLRDHIIHDRIVNALSNTRRRAGRKKDNTKSNSQPDTGKENVNEWVAGIPPVYNEYTDPNLIYGYPKCTNQVNEQQVTVTVRRKGKPSPQARIRWKNIQMDSEAKWSKFIEIVQEDIGFVEETEKVVGYSGGGEEHIHKDRHIDGVYSDAASAGILNPILYIIPLQPEAEPSPPSDTPIVQPLPPPNTSVLDRSNTFETRLDRLDESNRTIAPLKLDSSRTIVGGNSSVT